MIALKKSFLIVCALLGVLMLFFMLPGCASAADSTFSVTLPVSLPVTVKPDGSCECPMSGICGIENGSSRKVRVSDVKINPVSSWQLKDFDNFDAKKCAVGEKSFAFELNGEKTDDKGILSYNSGRWQYIDTGKSQKLFYGAKVAPQPAPLAATSAGVVFTVECEPLKSYDISFYDWDGSLLEKKQVTEGNIPVYTGSTPKRAAGDMYEYTFSGWSPEIHEADSDTEYTAVYTRALRKYTVRYENWDGSLIASYKAEYGSMPEYSGPVPEREKNAMYSYTFSGWSPEEKEVSGDAVYTAVYDSSLNSYDIVFRNWDGSVLEKQSCEYGSIPVYKGKTPERNSTAQYTYTFSGWSPEISAVSGECGYTAVFTSSVNRYTVRFLNSDGSVLKQTQAEYGSMPGYSGSPVSPDASVYATYVFDGWDRDISSVTQNADYTAQYKKYTRKITVAMTTNSFRLNIASLKAVLSDGTEVNLQQYVNSNTLELNITDDFTISFKNRSDRPCIIFDGETVMTGSKASEVLSYTVKGGTDSLILSRVNPEDLVNALTITTVTE